MCTLKKEIFCFVFPRITITTKGKNSAIEANAIPNLVKLLDDPESEVRLNALKVSYHPTSLSYPQNVKDNSCQ